MRPSSANAPYVSRDFLSSTASHARASFQSRMTVCGETPQRFCRFIDAQPAEDTASRSPPHGAAPSGHRPQRVV